MKKINPKPVVGYIRGVNIRVEEGTQLKDGKPQSIIVIGADTAEFMRGTNYVEQRIRDWLKENGIEST